MLPPDGIVRTAGDGPDLLLIHGTATDASSWDVLTRLLRDRIRVSAYDRRGTANWPIADADMPAIADHAADAADVIVSLGTGPVYVCGLSIGGSIALELIRQRPDLVRGAVLFEPAVAANDQVGAVPAALLDEFDRLVSEGKGPQAAEQFHRRLLSERGWELLPPAAKAQARGLWKQIHRDLSATAAYRLVYSELGRVDVPVLLLRGGRSRPVFEASLRALDAALPHSERKVIENAGHWMVGQAWPELANALTAFILLSPQRHRGTER